MDLAQLQRAHNEWEAWQKVCAVLCGLGIEINEQDVLNTALVSWGRTCRVLGVGE